VALSERDLEFLQQFIAGEPDRHGEQRAHCPMPDHEDENPSASINFEKGVWHCQGCDQGGGLRTLVKRLSAWKGPVGKQGGSTAELGTQQARRSQAGKPGPTAAQAQGYHDALIRNRGPLHDYLVEERGLDMPTIVQFRIGWSTSKQRYTVPVYDYDGSLVNIRFYKPHAKKNDAKWTNVSGHGRRRIFGAKMLRKVDTVLLAEGEWDAILATQYSFAAVSSTGGAKNWPNEFADLFTGKRVFVVYDCDDEGRAGAKRAAEGLYAVASEVFVVDLGLEKSEDLTDFFVKYGQNADDLSRLLASAEHRPFVPAGRTRAVEGDAQRVPLGATYDARYSGQVLEVVGTVVGKKNPPFQTPRRLLATCSQDWSEKACPTCPMSAHGGEWDREVLPNDEATLKFMDIPSTKEKAVLKELFDVPARCPSVKFERKESQNIERLIVGPSMDNQPEEGERDSRTVYSVGRPGVDTNMTVRLVGTNTPDPRSQLNAFMVWDVQETESSIDTFEVDEHAVQLMERFQCGRGQDPLDKMREVARDLSENVTHIYGRENLQMATDLVMHSILQIPLRGRVIKGWLDFIVLGDTRTGKSELVTKTTQHYGAGVVANCETATMAGLLGAVKQHGNDWSLEWGLIPLNDRRCVVLDEASGLHRHKENIIAQLSGVRSSGLAEVHKVESGKTHARTRLIWISNPVTGENLSDVMHGVQELRRLIGNNEDVARFDMAMGCTLGEVDFEEIRKANREKVEHRYTSEACRALVLWAWSRKPSQVRWARGAEDKVYKGAAWLGRRYVNDPPLLQQTNSHEKIARLACAVAARVFSTDSTHERVIVRGSHVRAAVRFLDSLYSAEAFGYRSMSRNLLGQDRHAARSRRVITEYLRDRPRLQDFLYRSALRGGRFKAEDLRDYLGTDQTEANIVMNRLYESYMIEKESSTATIKPILNRILKELNEEQ
jgi:hypothetical protein